MSSVPRHCVDVAKRRRIPYRTARQLLEKADQLSSPTESWAFPSRAGSLERLVLQPSRPKIKASKPGARELRVDACTKQRPILQSLVSTVAI